jgi:ATP-dependent protease ClpP protease subunit
MEDAQRDLWLSSDEAVKYGIVDSVIQNKPKHSPKTKK